MLLRAFLELAEVREDIYLGIIGDGNLKKKLQLIVLKSKFGDRVRFYGQLSRKRIANP